MAIKFTNLTPSGNAMGIVEDSVAGIGVRWLDAWGDVEKHVAERYISTDYTTTLTGAATVASSATPGTLYTITTVGTEYSGAESQAVGTHYQLVAGRPLYYGIRCQVSDATQTDLLFGLCGTDTALTNASTSHAIAVSAGGVFFSKLDGVTSGFFKSYGTSTETNSAAAFTLDTNPHTYEMYWNGTILTAYIDGVEVGSFSSGLPTGALTPSISFRAGEAVIKTANVYWRRAIQARS